MNIHKEFISALINAAWKQETLIIDGGIFRWDEYADLIDSYKAAPDLLAALELILSYDDQQMGADIARAAIAKAKGES